MGPGKYNNLVISYSIRNMFLEIRLCWS